MIGPLLLLPASLLAAQITISQVSAEREGGRVAITVKGDAMIDPEATSATLGEGRLYLFVYDARVHEANRAWKNDVAEGAEEIRAHRHKQKVELAIPLGDNGCQGPVELEKAPGGLRALVGCEGGPRPSSSAAARASRPAVERTESAKSESRVTTLPASASPTAVKPDALGAALKAKLSLEPEPAPVAAVAAKTVNVARVAAPAAKTVATATPATVPAVAAAPSKAAVSPSLPAASPPTASLPAAPLPGPASHDALAPASAASSGGGNGNVVLAGGALLAIAGAAFYLSRRRAAGSHRHIQILETASLGPKRALVVARVGDSTLILGSSEAGITLLQSVPDADAARHGGGMAIPELSFAPPAAVLSEALPPRPPSDPTLPKIVVEEPPSGAPVAIVPGAGGSNSWSLDKYGLPAIEEEIATVIEDVRPIGQAGLLSRLFKRGTPANDAAAPRFEDILEDSFEDQELRRKLALGLPGRVR